MKLRLPENSLFAILLRSRWWVSALAGVAAFGAGRLLLPAGAAAFLALPFVVIALYAGARELRAPGPARVAKALERARAMSRDGFCAALEEAWRAQGYAVQRAGGPQIDLELSRNGRVTLVGCKRWKAVRTGVEALREFHAAARTREADERLYVAAGEITDQARAFAAEKNVKLLERGELGKLLSRL